MKNRLIPALILAFTAISYAQADTTGAAAGSKAATSALGSSEAKGIGTLATITAIALLTAGGGDGSTTSTNTTTTTVAAK